MASRLRNLNPFRRKGDGNQTEKPVSASSNPTDSIDMNFPPNFIYISARYNVNMGHIKNEISYGIPSAVISFAGLAANIAFNIIHANHPGFHTDMVNVAAGVSNAVFLAGLINSGISVARSLRLRRSIDEDLKRLERSDLQGIAIFGVESTIPPDIPKDKIN